MKLKDILKGVDCISGNSQSETEISAMYFDSRKVTPGSLFFALRGVETDGHKFIPAAVKLGAAAIICEDDAAKSEFPAVEFLKVKDARLAMALTSENFFGNPSGKLNMAGVTGTNGKTTVTFLIRNILESLGTKTGIIGTTGIYIGSEKLPAEHTTPESLELSEILAGMVRENAENAIMEVSSHALCQKRTAGVNFSAALFTNLTQDHLDYHKTMNEYAKAKKILFDGLDENALAIVFDTSEYSKYMLEDCQTEMKYLIGYRPEDDILIEDYSINSDFTKFTLRFQNKLAAFGSTTFFTKLIGKFNVENAALAVSYLILSGRDAGSVMTALAEATGAPGRMDKRSLPNGAVGVVDYAHTPDALAKALQTCREILPEKAKLICVFGCGGNRDTGKRAQMGHIATNLADISVITDDNPRNEDPADIINEIIAGIPVNNYFKFRVITPRDAAIRKAYELSSAGDLILVAGKGHEDYQILADGKHHFSDFEVLEKL